MDTEVNELTVNGVTYIKKNTETKMADKLDGLPYVICRTYSAGVFAGYLKSRNGKEVTLLNARRLWYWDGAASLSQLAMEGTKKPKTCKFPCEMSSVELTEAIEIIECSEAARLSIKNVHVWQE